MSKGLKYIVRVTAKDHNATHRIFKTEKGARDYVKRVELEDEYAIVELYQQIPTTFTPIELGLFKEELDF